VAEGRATTLDRLILVEAAAAYGREESEADFIEAARNRLRDQFQATDSEVLAAIDRLKGPPISDAWPWGTPTFLG
jgi:hypothetical protein